MKLIVVDDNKSFRDGITYYLENILFYEVIGVAGDGNEFLEMTHYYESDLILMDIEMPNLNGIDAIILALRKNPYLKFIAVTNYTDKAYLHDLLSAGFKACVFKTDIYDELEEAIATVLKGKFYFPENINIKKD